MRIAQLERFDGGCDSFLCKNLGEFVVEALDNTSYTTKKKKNRKTKQLEPISMYTFFMTFDIESTTITPEEYIKYETKRQELKKNVTIPANVPRPYAFMYHWQAKIAGEILYGHYWDEVFDFFELLRDYLGLKHNKRLVCYIHNLGFESWWMLPFIKKRYGEVEMFATAPKKPLKMFIPALGIEFRCSQRLSNMSLQKAVEFEKGTIHPKAAGDLDYKAIHLPSEELNDREFGYTIADVVSLYEFIQNRLDNEGDDLFSIPLTSTGYIR